MYQIYLRIAGYVVTLAMHIGNAVWMANSFHEEVMKNPYVKHFYEMQYYFFTCWTFFFQIVYAALSLYCDIISMKHSGNRPPKILKRFRDIFYITIVWPSTMLVFFTFWTFFIYDRELVYPKDIDLAISSTSNHIMHTNIAFVAIWEIIFKPRTKPRNHKWYILIIMGLHVAFFSTLLGVYRFKGVWIYPIFGLLSGSIYFHVLVAVMGVAAVLLYYAQWILTDLLWAPKERQSGINFKASMKTSRLRQENGAKKNK